MAAGSRNISARWEYTYLESMYTVEVWSESEIILLFVKFENYHIAVISSFKVPGNLTNFSNSASDKHECHISEKEREGKALTDTVGAKFKVRLRVKE